MELTTKAAIKAATVKPVTLASGNVAYIRVMSGKTLSEWQDLKADSTSFLDARVELLIRTLCDPEGTRIYSDKDAVELLDAMDCHTITDLYEAVIAHNMLSPKAEAEVKKNSGVTDSSGSASPATLG